VLVLVWYNPASHSVQLTADAVETVPAAQSKHTSDPFMAVYFPATQPAHMPFAPDQPALHRQSLMAPLPTAEYESARHNWQRDLLSIEYEPAAQYVQLVANAPENFPTAQPMHTSDPFLEV